jgi:hypothetical protein
MEIPPAASGVDIPPAAYGVDVDIPPAASGVDIMWISHRQPIAIGHRHLSREVHWQLITSRQHPAIYNAGKQTEHDRL